MTRTSTTTKNATTMAELLKEWGVPVQPPSGNPFMDNWAKLQEKKVRERAAKEAALEALKTQDAIHRSVEAALEKQRTEDRERAKRENPLYRDEPDPQAGF